MLIRTFINFDEPLTEEEKEEIRALKNRPIVFDEDCMPISDEQWDYYEKLMKKYNTRRITKEILIAEGKIKANVAS